MKNKEKLHKTRRIGWDLCQKNIFPRLLQIVKIVIFLYCYHAACKPKRESRNAWLIPECIWLSLSLEWTDMWDEDLKLFMWHFIDKFRESSEWAMLLLLMIAKLTPFRYPFVECCGFIWEFWRKFWEPIKFWLELFFFEFFLVKSLRVGRRSHHENISIFDFEES